MLSDYLGEKKNFAKGPEFWRVGFVSPEKHCSEVTRQREINMLTYLGLKSTFLELIRCVKLKFCCFLSEIKVLAVVAGRSFVIIYRGKT